MYFLLDESAVIVSKKAVTEHLRPCSYVQYSLIRDLSQSGQAETVVRNILLNYPTQWRFILCIGAATISLLNLLAL